MQETKSHFKELYRRMIRIRLVEEKISSEYQSGLMRCPVHLSIGQEAIAVGVCSQLRPTDIVFSTHRCHAHYLAKGGNLPAMISELMGKTSGSSHGFGGSMRLIDLSANFWGATPIVANSIPVAVGVAFALQLRRRHSLVVVFFGEAATEEGVFYESVNFAVLHRLPILFVCENNLYSVNTPLRLRQPSRSISQIARSLGALADTGNGNNIIDVSKMSKRATSQVRVGKGPYLLEFATYRTMEHCGPNPDPFRPKKETEFWAKRDPLVLFYRQNERLAYITKGEMMKIQQSIASEINAAFDTARKSTSKAVNIESFVYRT